MLFLSAAMKLGKGGYSPVGVCRLQQSQPTGSIVAVPGL